MLGSYLSRSVFDSGDEAMKAGIEWFKTLDIVPWD